MVQLKLAIHLNKEFFVGHFTLPFQFIFTIMPLKKYRRRKAQKYCAEEKNLKEKDISFSQQLLKFHQNLN